MTITRAEALWVALECVEAQRAEYFERATCAADDAWLEAVDCVLNDVEPRLREAFAVPEFDRATASVGDVDPVTGWTCTQQHKTGSGTRMRWTSPGRMYYWTRTTRGRNKVNCEAWRTYDDADTLDDAVTAMEAMEERYSTRPGHPSEADEAVYWREKAAARVLALRAG